MAVVRDHDVTILWELSVAEDMAGVGTPESSGQSRHGMSEAAWSESTASCALSAVVHVKLS